MSEDNKKTIAFTMGQLGIGGCIVAAITILNPVKEWFFTREEGRAQELRIEQVRLDIVGVQEELTRRLERSSDKIIDRIKETEERTSQRADRLEDRIEYLEATSRPKSKTSNN